MKPNRTRMLILLWVVFGLVGIRIVAHMSGGPFLHNAVRDGDATRARVLVWLGCDPNYRTGSGGPLHYAAARGDVPLIQFLLRHGARVDSEVKFGITPLWKARFNHQSEAERVLLAHGANPNTSKIQVP